VHAALEGLGPNVEGNRRADELLAEDQDVYRRVRLTVVLGPSVHDSNRVAGCRDTARSLMLRSAAQVRSAVCAGERAHATS